MSTTSEGCPTKAAHGTFCWNERLCWDVERAKKFYADAIGWTFTSMPTPTGETYWCAMQDGRPVAGLFTLTSPYFDGVPEGWMSYLAVDDVDRRVAKATAAGAKLLRPIFDVSNVGRIAILDEPGGAGGGWMTPAA
jgi:predicted enzyme related to lactoylglutathione lyase